MDNAKSKYMLRKQAKQQAEYFKFDLIKEIAISFNLLLKIPDIKAQEEAKGGLVNTIKKMYPKLKINCFDNLEKISEIIQMLFTSQENELKTLVEENEKDEKLNIYSIVAKISIALNLTLRVDSLTVLEFIEYYKIAFKNGE